VISERDLFFMTAMAAVIGCSFIYSTHPQLKLLSCYRDGSFDPLGIICYT